MRLFVYIFLYCIVFCTAGYGQSEKKAIKYAEGALKLKSERKYTEACAAMEEALTNDPVNGDNYSMLGEWYFEGHDFAKSVETFRKASAKCHNGKLRFMKPMVRSLIYNGNADEALMLISNYATLKDSAEWNFYYRQATFVKKALLHSSGTWPESLGPRVNSESPELFPTMAADGKQMFFTRRMNNQDEDLYYAWADSCGGWLRADNAGAPPNSANQESSQFISADGHYLFFTRCENFSPNGSTMGGCDLFMAYRVKLDGEWTQPQPFGQTINNPTFEGMPSLSPDNTELYFVSDRKGGYGGYDIWLSRFENGLWQLPENAGPAVNTAGNETAPFIAADNKTLFFSSDYRPGLGGTDLFISRRKGDGSWGEAENMGHPINTAYDERSAFVSLDGKTLLFGSDRGGPAGNYDIYKVSIPPLMGPTPVSYLQGFVLDSISRERLNSANIIICNATLGDTLYTLRSNRGDGSYVINLQPGKTYAIHTSRMGYTELSDTVELGKEYANMPLTHNIAMLARDYDPVQHIHDSLAIAVHFDKNVTELTDEEKQALHATMEPWLDEKGIVLYINAYTDNTGTPMINESLSAKRANIVAKELQAMGFIPEMMTARGWGEANPIASNDTDEGQLKNRRVEVIINR
jgi:outer membrane protein OmpA-like peptidoglycan-associated protein